MPKFYVQSEQVKVVLDAHDAQQAAVTAFQLTISGTRDASS